MRLSIRARLLGLFILLTVAGMAAFMTLWVFGLPNLGVEGMNSQEYRRAIAGVEAAADRQRDLTESWFDAHRRELRLMSSDESLARAVEAMQTRRGPQADAARALALRRLSALKASSQGSFRSLVLLDAAGGELLAATDGRATDNIALPDWINEALVPGMSESVHVFDDASGPQSVVIGQILQVDAQGATDGKLIGLLLATLSLDVPLQQGETMLRQVLGQAGMVLLVDRSARILLKQDGAALSGEAELVAQQVVSGTEGMRLLQTPSGRELIAVVRYLHLGASDALSIAVVQGTDEALATIKTSFWRMAGLLGLLFAAAMGLVVFAANRIARAEAQVRSLNAHLEQRILERTHELDLANRDLTKTLNHLNLTRNELVRNEKLTALGALVAGVSHELNTPLGISVTVASTMADHHREFKLALAQGLRRSTLDAFVVNSGECLEVIVRSLQRAVDLVGSFKQVAVDQTSVNLRGFDLREVIDDVLMTLGPTIRKSRHQMQIKVPLGISMHSYPGPLGQVIGNLVDNAILHGLQGVGDGRMELVATLPDASSVELRFSDNGAGIPAEHISRLFDPFFTTKLGQGGSGLGLNIVYNLVTQTLRGQVQVQSEPGQGACFIVRLPLHLQPSESPP